MKYHVISDNSYYLSGAAAALSTIADSEDILCSWVNLHHLQELKVKLNYHPGQKIIIHIGCIRTRRVILKLIAVRNLKVLIAVHFRFCGGHMNRHPMLIPSRCSKEEFLLYVLNKKYNYIAHYGHARALYIIKQLSTGMSVNELSQKMKVSAKIIYGTKDAVMHSMGLRTMKAHGLFLCRDILEMGVINKKYLTAPG